MSEFKIEWVEQYLKRKPSVIFDAGCYDGYDAVRLKKNFPDALVVAIEACPDNYARIKSTGIVEANGVIPEHFAVSDKDGSMEFFSCADARHKADDDGCSGSILPPTDYNLEKYPFLRFKSPRQVPTTRLDTYCKSKGIDHIDVLHMDVQGAESFAIKGLGEIRPGMIFLEIDATEEYVGAAPLGSLRQLLEERGYKKEWEGEHDALYVLSGVKQEDPIDSLTVAITNFKRANFLDRALTSVWNCGIRRVVIASVEPDRTVENIIAKYKQYKWTSFDVATVSDDIGCNNTWMLAAYRCRTDRIIILHDDDVLLPELGKAYREIISPAMDAGAGFASWRPEVLLENGSRQKCEYFHGDTRVIPSTELSPVIKTCLTHSPVISVFDRKTVIWACKESEQVLTSNDSKERPGMLLGTELIVYIRHIKKFPKWLYANQVLSLFGSHPGSGTIANIRSGKIEMMRKGYEIAKKAGELDPPPPTPKIIFSYYADDNSGPETAARNALARKSWDFHFGQFSMIELKIRESDMKRTSESLGDIRPVPYVRDLFDFGCSFAMPEDIVVYCNHDIGLTTMAVDRIFAGVERGGGVTVCQRRQLNPTPGRLYRSVLNCKADGGFDVMAVTPSFWGKMRNDMPDMLIGREAWDTCFRALVEIYVTGKKNKVVLTTPEQWAESKAYTDDVCWHIPHDSWWDKNRKTNPAQIHNRTLAKKFCSDNGMIDFVAEADVVRARFRTRPEDAEPVEVFNPPPAPVNRAPSSDRKMLMVLCMCPLDVKQGVELLKLWADMEDSFNKSISIAICVRFDMSIEKDIGQPLIDKLSEKFQVFTHVVTERGSDTGWPAGCNSQQIGAYQWFVESNRNKKFDFEYMLMVEPDTVPTRKGWSKEIMNEAYDNKALIIGSYFVRSDDIPHINGNCVMHRDLWRTIRSIWDIPSNIGWDCAIGKDALACGKPSKLIWQEYKLGTPRNPWRGPEVLFEDKAFNNPENPLHGQVLYPAMIHGVKTMEGIAAVRKKIFGSPKLA